MLKKFTACLGVLVFVGGCTDSSKDEATIDYNASIRYTSYGIPHVKADDYGSLGFGLAYAQTKENICTIAEQLMKASGKKSFYFGPGAGGVNIATDIGYIAMDYPGQAETLIEELSPEARLVLSGYVAGYNQSLLEMRTDNTLPPICADAEWLVSITESQLLGYHLEISELASGRQFLPAMGAATPPVEILSSAVRAKSSSPLTKPTNNDTSTPSIAMATYDYNVKLNSNVLSPSTGIGSNGWGLGKNWTESENAMLLGNPHFPWEGELRFFINHMTIPGKLDVMGATLIGMPAVILGFNDDVAWTHTVSQAKHFTFYQLVLNPQNPKEYLFDGNWVPMTSKSVSLEYLLPNGTRAPLEQDVYFSHYGPIIDLSSVSPSLGWSTSSALTYRDANKSNPNILGTYLEIAKSVTSQDIIDAFAKDQSNGWVNTVSIDKSGRATYVDATNTPNFNLATEQYWRGVLASDTAGPQLEPIWQGGKGSILLPGVSSVFDWESADNAVVAGLNTVDSAPRITSSDYAFNSNSSHWLSNLDSPLEGYSMVYGPEQTERSPRTRFNGQLIANANDLKGSDGKYSFAELKSVLTDSGSLFGVDFKNEVVAACNAQPSVDLEGVSVDLTSACLALDGWDGKYLRTSRGAHVMREVLNQYRVNSHKDIADSLFEVPFNQLDPINTPRGLSDSSGILEALARTVTLLSSLDIVFNASLEELQFVVKNGEAIAVPGGYSHEGVFNMAEKRVLGALGTSELANLPVGTLIGDSLLTSRDDDNDGVDSAAYRVNYGTSIVFAAEMTPSGPVVDAFLTYGQSHEPSSENFTNLTQRYSDGEWLPMSFSESAIEADLVETIQLSGSIKN